MDRTTSSGSGSASRSPADSPTGGGISLGALPSEAVGGAPSAKMLKRGAACVICRKRKLRCSGERPSCTHCQKNRCECVYDDVGKPRSRVKQLEDKIATLENILSHAGPSSLQFNGLPPNLFAGSSAVLDTPPAASYPYPHGHQPRAPQSHTTSDPTPLSDQEAFSLTLQGLFRSDGGSGGLVDATMSNPDPTGSREAAGGGGLAGAHVPAFKFNPHLPAAFHFASEPAPLPPPPPPPPPQPAPPFAYHDHQPPMFPLPPAAFPQSSYPPTNPAVYTGMPSNMFDTFPPISPVPPPQQQQPTPPSAWPPAEGPFVLPTTWDERTTIPLELRAHLLEIFLRRRRQFVLTIDFGRFMRSLDGPLKKQPSPALLFSMYACAAGCSPLSEIKELADRFIEVARKHLSVALKDMTVDLLGALQASCLLGFLLYSRGSYAEGWTQLGVSVRLAVCCGLHRITSSDIAQYNIRAYHPLDGPFPPYRTTYTRLGPPKDAIELGERIAAFWIVYRTDRSASIGSGWPVGLADEMIQTPFPRPLEEYANLDLSTRPDHFLSDVFSTEPLAPLGLGNIMEATFLQAVALYHRIGNLREHPQILAALASRPASWSPASSTGSDARGGAAKEEEAVLPMPPILIECEKMLRRFVDAMPPCASVLKVPGGVRPWNEKSQSGGGGLGFPPNDGSGAAMGINVQVYALNSTLYTTFMLLFEEMSRFDFATYNAKAVQAGSLAVSQISHIIDVDFAELDITLVVLWRLVARFLLQEAKRLRAAGVDGEASQREVDVEVLLLSMRRMGQVWEVGDHQARIIEAIQHLSVGGDED